MCVLIKERVESEALKKGATLEDIAEMYPGIFNSTKVSMETLRSLATLLDCDVDYITGRDLNRQNANFEINVKISVDHLDKAMQRFPMLNCKVLSYLVSGTPYTIYGARKDKKLAPRYIKNAAYYLNCSYDFLTNDDCTSIGKPSTLPNIPKNFQAIDNKSIVAKAGILNITPASLGSKCKIGSVNGTRICNGEIKFLPAEIISTLASVLKCTTQEIVSPAYLNNSSTVSASTMIEDEFDEMEKEPNEKSNSEETSMIPCNDSLSDLSVRDLINMSMIDNGEFMDVMSRLYRLNDMDRITILKSIEPMLKRFEN